ncbi:Prophage CP4-57 regulatory protein (AlpA) [Anatilimnocola aggregata]|uniref:Prophage CP4-57 regulatory protein (AlpA) n=1 Tax=Anatilimnocola aggregata TaxID=2528021 RepID=A0A517YM93_9BACT|nr:helix-turn-helix domain-containing protein [Anatilimnocola aggregata]QDU31340.1 Prophage CP4-57 regulatory protein (AlpA) [Anatilimnocola aggregata]
MADSENVQLITVAHVSELLACSQRHVYRLVDGGKMPPPVRIGALVRWDRDVIAYWIANGCRPVRAQPAKGTM